MGREITMANRLPRAAVERLKELQVEDPRLIAILNRCWGNRKFIEASVAMLNANERGELLAPRQGGWRAKAGREYENCYRAEFNDYYYGTTIRELTAWLKKELSLTEAQHKELDGIRRAARGRGMRLAEKDRKDREGF